MATINSITFNQALYTPGQTIQLTAVYTPDAALESVVTSQATVSVSQAGVVTAQESAPFEVQQAGAGDTVAVSDTGGRTWTQDSSTASSDGTITVVFTATA